MRGLRPFAWVVSLLLWLPSASNRACAWETLVHENAGKGDSSWKSIYQTPDANQAAAKYRGKAKKPREEYAEHTRIADMALRRLGVYDLFGRKGRARINIVDLNSSLFRFETLGDLPREGDNPDTEMEERLIVPPAFFAGIPDYSYTIYDWLNKNELCAAGESPELQKKCHVFFMGWHGNLNSTHFGSQAEKMYKNYHLLALSYARRAKKLHDDILFAAGKKGEEYYRDFIKEAEHLALGYEGFAQHFLQDRWAIGHMWQRWGSGEFRELPSKSNAVNTMVGMIAGMIHGSEAVLNKEHNISEMLSKASFSLKPSDAAMLVSPAAGILQRLFTDDREVTLSSDYLIGRDSLKLDPSKYINVADPMSSPLIVDENTVEVMKWKHASDASGRLINGVGDERLTDMVDGKFGAPYFPYYKDMAIDVSEQQEGLMQCSTAGWAEVIKALGKYDGGYGIYRAQLQNDPGFNVLRRRKCWDMWATNESIYTGIARDKAVNYSILGRLAFGRPDGIAEKTLSAFLQSHGLGLFNKELVRLTYNVEAEKIDDPKGISLALGGVGPLFDTETGNHYALPDYVELPSPNELPAESRTGKDRQTIFGAFSRANSDYWCQNFRQVFSKYDLRGSNDRRKQEICEYLADFAYDGTEPFYDGSQKEQRKVGDKVIPSMCTIRNRTTDRGDANFPRHLDQGYVPHGHHGHPQDRTADGLAYESVANWCRKIPIIYLPYGSDKKSVEMRNNNIVAEIEQGDIHLVLDGSNFGDNEGKVYYWKEGSDYRTKKAFGLINSWQEGSLDIDTSRYADLEPDTTYLLEVETAPDGQGKTKSSVGLFRLRVLRPDRVKPMPTSASGVGPCGDKFAVHANLLNLNEIRKQAKGVNVEFFERVKQAYQPFKKAALAEVSRNIACVARLDNNVRGLIIALGPEFRSQRNNYSGFYAAAMMELDLYRRFAEAIERDIEDKIYMLRDKNWLYSPMDYRCHMPCHLYDTMDSSTLPSDLRKEVSHNIEKIKNNLRNQPSYMKEEQGAKGIATSWHMMYGVAHRHDKVSWQYIGKMESERDKINKTLEYLDKHGNDKAVEQLARRSHMSVAEIKQMFARAAGGVARVKSAKLDEWKKDQEGMFHALAHAFDDLNLLFRQVAVGRMADVRIEHDRVVKRLHDSYEFVQKTDPKLYIASQVVGHMPRIILSERSTDIHAILDTEKKRDGNGNARKPLGAPVTPGMMPGLVPLPEMQAVPPLGGKN